MTRCRGHFERPSGEATKLHPHVFFFYSPTWTLPCQKGIWSCRGSGASMKKYDLQFANWLLKPSLFSRSPRRMAPSVSSVVFIYRHWGLAGAPVGVCHVQNHCQKHEEFLKALQQKKNYKTLRGFRGFSFQGCLRRAQHKCVSAFEITVFFLFVFYEKSVTVFEMWSFVVCTSFCISLRNIIGLVKNIVFPQTMSI